MINIGVIGYGYWGPNLVRNFAEAPDSRVVAVSDLRPERLTQVQHRYPAVKTTVDYRELLTILPLMLLQSPRRSRPILTWLCGLCTLANTSWWRSR